MNRFWTVIFLLAFLLGACTPGDIEANRSWARAALAGENSAIYLELQNRSSQADDLLGVSSDVAESVEVHKSTMDANGVMQMVRQESVPLAKGEDVAFAPGGLHIMLVGLTRDLKAGDHFQVTLHFRTHADITFDVTVQEMEGMQMPSHQP